MYKKKKLSTKERKARQAWKRARKKKIEIHEATDKFFEACRDGDIDEFIRLLEESER